LPTACVYVRCILSGCSVNLPLASSCCHLLLCSQLALVRCSHASAQNALHSLRKDFQLQSTRLAKANAEASRSQAEVRRLQAEVSRLQVELQQQQLDAASALCMVSSNDVITTIIITIMGERGGGSIAPVPPAGPLHHHHHHHHHASPWGGGGGPCMGCP